MDYTKTTKNLSIAFCMLILATALILIAAKPAMSCTVAVVSGRAATDGRPMIWKNFDMSQYWHQQVKHFPAENNITGSYYLLYHDNDSIWTSSSAITPQAGANQAGFSIAVAAVTEYNIINAASNYNTHLLHDAVINCATLTDFEDLLNNWPKSHSGHAVSANYVAIDAQGGAALYEVYTGNYIYPTTKIMYKKYDANTGEVVDYKGNVLKAAQGDSFIGFHVRSNLNSYFPNNSGSERYLRANSLLTELAAIDLSTGKTQLNPKNIMNIVSKDVTGSSGNNSNYDTAYSISRSQTRSGTVVEGVPSGGDPRLTVFWSALGEPSISVYVPAIIGAEAAPSYLYMDKISDGAISDNSDISVLNLAEDARETYKKLIYSSNRGSAITGPYDSTINKNELAKVQQWTFTLEDSVVNNTENFLRFYQDNPEFITSSSLHAFQEHCAKYVYDNYTAGSADAVPW